ncbi:hypothetical protein BST61_g9569 [Cercospora zeina]
MPQPAQDISAAVNNNHNPTAIAKLLIAYGTNVDTQESGFGNALQEAVTPPTNRELVQLLLEYGAEPNT